MSPSFPRAVRRRIVFYIPGYDPFPPRRYRELYRREGAEQARIAGYDLRIGPHRPCADASPAAGTARWPRFAWTVTADIEGIRTETTVEVLTWSDIVRASMSPSIPRTYWLLLRTAWIYGKSGALPALARLRTGPLIAAFLPVLLLLVQLALAVGLGLCVAALPRLTVAEAAGPLLRLAAALAEATLCVAVLRGFRALDRVFFAYYLIHDYAFASGRDGRTDPALAARLNGFAARIRDALDSDVGEVLVVGHSSGAALSVSAVARVLRDRPPCPEGPALSLLTLGQVIPMIAFLPGAGDLRADLHDLSRERRIAWVDVSAPGDGCCFALCDPVAVSGATPREGKRWPLILSAAFTRTLSPERQAVLRRRFFRLHFQYLCAFDRPDHYDYFRITAGPQTLGGRFAGRRPSPGRIETPRAPLRSRA